MHKFNTEIVYVDTIIQSVISKEAPKVARFHLSQMQVVQFPNILYMFIKTTSTYEGGWMGGATKQQGTAIFKIK